MSKQVRTLQDNENRLLGQEQGKLQLFSWGTWEGFPRGGDMRYGDEMSVR